MKKRHLIPLALAAAYALARPRIMRWGCTDAEANAHLPGDALIADAPLSMTQAATIPAPRAAVWPWLLQLGQNRGGFYSHAWIENLIGADVENIEALRPDLQIQAEGDRVSMGADYPDYMVETLKPERALVLHYEAETLLNTWAFILQGENPTRLLIRFRMGWSARGWLYWPLFVVLYPPAHLFMERQMIRTITRLATRHSTPRYPSG